MDKLKTGDTYNVTRDGKVFLTQYNAVGAHVSLTRVLGDDPEAEAASMQRLADRMWHDALLSNIRLVDGVYAAAGSGQEVDVEKMVEYLEAKARDDAQETTAGKAPLRKRKLGGK